MSINSLKLYSPCSDKQNISGIFSMFDLKPSAIHIREKQLCKGMITFPL